MFGDCVTRVAYEIESEIGQVVAYAHKIIDSRDKCTYYDSGTEFFEETASRERFKSNRFMELAFDLSTDVSVRRAAHFLNRMRLEEKGISPTTYRNTIERAGEAIQECMEKKCEETLLSNGFDLSGTLLGSERFTPNAERYMEQAVIESAAID